MTLYVDRPIPGFYRTRLVRGGPWVPVRIWRGFGVDPETGDTIERGWELRAERNGAPVDAYEIWTWCAGHPIDEAEYRYMCRLSEWAVTHAPDQPEAQPGRPINLHAVKPLF